MFRFGLWNNTLFRARRNGMGNTTPTPRIFWPPSANERHAVDVDALRR